MAIGRDAGELAGLGANGVKVTADVGSGSTTAAPIIEPRGSLTSNTGNEGERSERPFRAMYGRCPRCKRNLTFLRSVRVQPCIRPIFAWRRITSVAMQPQWLLALM